MSDKYIENLKDAEKKAIEFSDGTETCSADEDRLAKAKKRKIIFIAAPVAVVVVAFLVVLTKIIIPNNNKYNAAVALMDSGEYDAAIAAFVSLGDYKDSDARRAYAEKAIIKDAQKGDIVTFGTYVHDEHGGKVPEPIAWQVLDKQDGKALLISKYCLDAKPYNKERIDVTWERCTLRSWLNSDFLVTAFSEAEQSMLLSTILQNPDNFLFGTSGGNDTTDMVFLLSIDEAKQYFPTHASRTAQGTAFAKFWSGSSFSDGNSLWLLRSPGKKPDVAAYVREDGTVNDSGTDIYFSKSVRPVVWIDLKA